MYVVNPNEQTGRLEPMKVTKKQYDERCAKIGQKPTRFKTLEMAQGACNHVNPQEDTADEG